ncbi:MAG: methyl-accepting chemotaxis protein [Nitrospirota bacterium]
MSIKRLLMIVGVANAVVLGIILALFIVHNGKAHKRLEKMLAVDQALLLSLNEMHIDGIQTEQATRNVLINPNDETAKENYRKAHEEFIKENENAIKLATGKMQEQLKAVREGWNEAHKLKMDVQDLAVSGKKDEAVSMLVQKETPKWREIKASIVQLTKEQENTFKRSEEEGNKADKRGTAILVVVIVISLLGFSGLLFIINKTIQKNMAQALECFNTLERGELKEENKISDTGNFLKDVYNKILSTLRDTVVKISTVSSTVKQDVGILKEKVDKIEGSAKEQLSQVDHIASATAEMSQTIIDVAKNASSASEGAREAAAIAQKGKDTVKKAADAITGIAESVRNSSHTIEELGNSSKEIGEIVAVINDIADQTNLLALNAAIEAARAGEQGRGFAVVADEVRKLAERTSKATGEIAEKINAIQVQSQASVEAMVKSTQDAESGVSLADEALKALEEIVGATDKAMDMIQRIATATEEQSSASEEIARNMENITQLVNATSQMIAEARQTMDRLHIQEQELDRSISWFKV